MAIIALLGLSSFAIDFGRVFYEKQKLQAAIDATTVAAAKDLPDQVKAIDTANRYIVLNKYTEDNIVITFPDSNTINITTDPEVLSNYEDEDKVKIPVQVDYTLAKVIGFSSKNVNVTAAATVTTAPHPAAFDYALFAGSGGSITVNGWSNVKGNVYAEKGASMKHVTVDGVVQYNTAGKKNEYFNGDPVYTDKIEMPNLSTILDLVNDKTTYDSVEKINALFAGSGNVNIYGPVYVNGTVDISRLHGKGVVYALDFTGNLNTNSSDSICLITPKSGNIKLLGGSAELYGIIYAPNATVTFEGGDKDLHGRIICKGITYNGTGKDVIGTDKTLDDGLGTLYGKTVKIIK